MSKPPEEPKKLRTLPAIVAALTVASAELGAVWHRDDKGRIRAITDEGKVCCPVTLIALHRLRVHVPPNEVRRLFDPGAPHARPMINDLAVDIILATDKRSNRDRKYNPAIRTLLEETCQIAAVQEGTAPRTTPQTAMAAAGQTAFGVAGM